MIDRGELARVICEAMHRGIPTREPGCAAAERAADAVLENLRCQEACCDYRDHSPGPCACPEHSISALHPFGYETANLTAGAHSHTEPAG